MLWFASTGGSWPSLQTEHIVCNTGAAVPEANGQQWRHFTTELCSKPYQIPTPIPATTFARKVIGYQTTSPNLTTAVNVESAKLFHSTAPCTAAQATPALSGWQHPQKPRPPPKNTPHVRTAAIVSSCPAAISQPHVMGFKDLPPPLVLASFLLMHTLPHILSRANTCCTIHTKLTLDSTTTTTTTTQVA